MKGDFTRFTHDPAKHYSGVLKQQGRVDLDADWNEAVQLLTERKRTMVSDVVGRCGVPVHDNGFEVDRLPDGSDLTIAPGRIYVDGVLCQLDADDAISISEQPDLPGYEPPTDDGVYVAYVDVWERHITYHQDPDIREVALGGPDTATRTKVIGQVRLVPLDIDEPLHDLECVPAPVSPSTGRLSARGDTVEDPTTPCAVPAGGGYRGLENRLYRVEIHDDGSVSGTPTFKWSRDNGSVVLPVAESGISSDRITVARLGFDDVLTVRVDDWVEVTGDETELRLEAGTLAQIVPDGIDRSDLEITVDRDVSAHATETNTIVRRWDQRAATGVALNDGAVPIQAGPFELEDGLFIEFDPGGTYHVGDYWLIPARTREGAVLWPTEGPADTPVLLEPFGIRHHYCTLALVRRVDDEWTEVKDCRPLFPPLTEVGDGCCCETVEPGEDIQQAIDTVVGAGGGCITLCEGVHEVNGPLVISNASDVRLIGEGNATVLLLNEGEQLPGGLNIVDSQRVSIERLFAVSNSVNSLIRILHDADRHLSREIAFKNLTLLNTRASNREDDISTAIRLGHTDGVTIDSCRIAAEVGIAGLWGNALPDLSGAIDNEEDALGYVEITFDDLTPGTTFEVGDTFTTNDVDVSCEEYTFQTGETFSDGEATVANTGGVTEIQIGSGLNLSFDMGPGYRDVNAGFSFGGGSLNLRVNGQREIVADMMDLDGLLLAGVRVRIIQAVNGNSAVLTLAEETAPVTDFAFGGTEFALSGVIFRGVDEQPQIPDDLSFGSGVRDLRMRESEIRFIEFGILAAKANDWHIDTSRIEASNREVWASLGPSDEIEIEIDALSVPMESAARAPYVQILDRLELLFGTPESDPQGVGIVSLFWLGCTIERSVVSGDSGVLSWLQLDGIVDRTNVSAGELGIASFWMSRSTWADNTVRTSGGPCLGFSGCSNVNINGNTLRGPSGLANFSTRAGLVSLLQIGTALGRAYGTSSATDLMVVLWIVVEEMADILGLRKLLDALQAFLPNGLPAGLYLSAILTSQFQRQKTDNSSSWRLPVANLDVRDNDFSCNRHCVFIDRFVPLGAVRLSDNRIQTVEGQAVSIHATPFFANAHLLGLLVRWLFKAALAQLRRSEQQASNDNTGGLISAARELMSSWASGIERFLEFDFRIESNTIRSLRTAIESNLFELAILDNHITLQERSLEAAVERGTLFGSVLRADGSVIPNASVRVDGTPRVVTTDENGSYEMVGLPAGSYTLTASAALMNPASQEVDLEADERLQVDFVLEEGALGNYSTDTVGHVYTGEVMAEMHLAVVVTSNSSISEMIAALERSSAMAPLANVLREGAHTNPTYYGTYLLSEAGPLSTAAERNDAADAVAIVGGLAADPDLKSTASTLDQALRNNDETLLAVVLPRFIKLLMAAIDSKGILLKGLGGRIVGNQIIVPADVDSKTESQGGIQLSVSYMEAMVAVILGQWLLALVGSKKQLDPDPLLGVTESLIDNNEVIGGISHGISVQGVAGVPDVAGDLTIRNNQLRGCGGTGILIDEHGFVAGLNIDGNLVVECGRSDSFSRFRNGITIQNAGICVIRDNTIRLCGTDAGQSTFGISLDSIYGLKMHGNEILSNGSSAATPDDGGARLTEVYGAASIQDNNFSYNNGHGLSWANSARSGEEAFLPDPLMNLIDLYLRIVRGDEGAIEEDQATIQGNLFNSIRPSGLVLFNLMNIGELNFSGNSCRSTEASAPLGEIKQSALAVIAGNLLHTNANTSISVKKVSAGVVSGNVGNKSIDIQFSGVQSNLNEPPTT